MISAAEKIKPPPPPNKAGGQMDIYRVPSLLKINASLIFMNDNS